MKKILIALILAAAICFAACAKSTPETSTNPDAQSSTSDPPEQQTSDPATEDDTESTEPVDEPLVTIDGLNLTIRDDGNGESGNANGLNKVMYINNDNIGFTTEVGPMKLTIDKIQLADVTCETSETASLLNVEKGAPFAMLVLDLSVENTSDKDMSWYPDQSVIVTNTKEQITTELLLNDNVGGDFYGEVVKTGQIFFVIPSSTSDKISHIQWRIDSPHDSNFDNYGDDLKIEIDFVK